MLGIMALPTVTSVAEDALSAVPPSACKEASTALGATRWETASKVVMPAASSGIITAVLLGGVSRAIGETMAVLMVAGGAIRMPSSFLQPVRPITAAIAAEMGEAPPSEACITMPYLPSQSSCSFQPWHLTPQQMH